MSACSFGQLNIVNEYSVNITEHEAAPGVIEVDINISLETNDRYTIHDAVTVAVQDKLGFVLPGPFEQVMYVLEKCYIGCGWAAYAYVNSWMSVYQGGYYAQAGVQMHEIGHNFGFAHSGGLNGQTYTDHTCQMGNPLYGDDEGKMCYNPAKNWAIGWYDSKKSEVNINKDVISHVETIVGIADFDNNSDERNVIIKLETGTSNDYFVGFNRAIGVNSQNDEADNEVTIVLTGNNGEAYSQSRLQATLQEGEYWALNGMIITAEEINITSDPGTAKVSIMKGSNPTNSPTRVPAPPTLPTSGPVKPPTLPTNSPIQSTPTPTNSPVSPVVSVRIWADASMLVRDWLWDVYDVGFYSNSDCTGINYNTGNVISSGYHELYPASNAFDADMDSRWGGRLSGSPRACWIGMSFTSSVDVQCVSFKDLGNNGAKAIELQILADNGSSKVNWTTLVRTENLTPGQRHNISVVQVTSTPTSSPMKFPTSTSPTNSPKKAPTPSPTRIPSKPPTSAPTNSPTKLPTLSPTRNPNKQPTPSPTQAPITIESSPPTKLDSCSEDSGARFLMKIKKKNGEIKVEVKSCNWLRKLTKEKKRTKICERKVLCYEEYGSAMDTCTETCDSCDPCFENSRSKFYYRTNKSGKVLTKPCSWLASLDNEILEKTCQKSVQTGVCYGSAMEVCPKSCPTPAGAMRCEL